MPREAVLLTAALEVSVKIIALCNHIAVGALHDAMVLKFKIFWIDSVVM